MVKGEYRTREYIYPLTRKRVAIPSVCKTVLAGLVRTFQECGLRHAMRDTCPFERVGLEGLQLQRRLIPAGCNAT